MVNATDDDRRHIARLMTDVRVAMLTNTTAEGRRVSRPRSLREAELDGDLWFFAFDDSVKVAQIAADPRVNVSFSETKDTSSTSVAGHAEVAHDITRAAERYTVTLKAW